MRKYFKDNSWVFALTLAALLSNLLWILFDRVPPIWDMAGHTERGVWLAQLILHGHLKTALILPGIYPPLVYWTTLPWYFLTGWQMDAPLFGLLPWLAAYIAAVYALALKIGLSKNRAVGAAALSLTYPLLGHFTRIFDLDFPLSAAVIAAIAALLYSDYFSRRKRSVAFGVLAAASFLVKWTAPVFLLAPVAWSLIVVVREKELRSARLKNVLIALAIVIAGAAPWCILHAQDVLRSVSATQDNIFSVPYATLWSWGNAGFYLQWIIRGISWPLAIFAAVGIVGGFWKNKTRSLWLALCILMPYIIFTFALHSKESRYLLPLLPLLAIWTAWGLPEKTIWLRRATFAVLGIVAAGLWLQTTWGVPLLSADNLRALHLQRTYGLQQVTPQSPYFGFTTPQPYASMMPDVLAAIADDSGTGKNGACVFGEKRTVRIAVAPNYIFFNNAQARMYARLAGWYVDSAPCVQWDFALSRLVRGGNWREELVKADYLITKTGDQGPSVWGKQLLEVKAAEQAGEMETFGKFEVIGEWEIGDVEGEQEIRLYQKR